MYRHKVTALFTIFVDLPQGSLDLDTASLENLVSARLPGAELVVVSAPGYTPNGAQVPATEVEFCLELERLLTERIVVLPVSQLATEPVRDTLLNILAQNPPAAAGSTGAPSGETA